MLVNPGSVGQPRDRDPRSAYAIYDTETRQWEARRVQYNVSEVQQRLREAGLPEKHAVRLAKGGNLSLTFPRISSSNGIGLRVRVARNFFQQIRL